MTRSCAARVDSTGRRLTCACGEHLARLVPHPGSRPPTDDPVPVAQLHAGLVPHDVEGSRVWKAFRTTSDNKPAYRRPLPLDREEGPCVDTEEAGIVCWRCGRLVTVSAIEHGFVPLEPLPGVTHSAGEILTQGPGGRMYRYVHWAAEGPPELAGEAPPRASSMKKSSTK